MSIKDKSKEYEDLKVNTSSKYYYQIKLSKDINNKLLNSDKVAGMLVLPTGGGKTRVAVTTAIDSAINNGYKVLWIAHRHMLLEQAEKTFQEFSELSNKELSINIISGKHNPIESIDKKGRFFPPTTTPFTVTFSPLSALINVTTPSIGEINLVSLKLSLAIL